VRSDEQGETRQARELAHSLALMRATLEATADGLVVTDSRGRITHHNERYRQMFGIPRETLEEGDHRAILRQISRLLPDPEKYFARVEEIYASDGQETSEVLELSDGRVIERSSRMQSVDGRNVGRVWSFRDISARMHAQRAARDHARTLEILHRVATTLASELDVQSILQTVTDAATQACGAQFGAFFYDSPNDQGDAYQLYTSYGAARESLDKSPLPPVTSISGPASRFERIVRSDDILADPQHGKSGPCPEMPFGHLPVRSYLAVPVTSRSTEVHGGLFFGHAEPGVFTAEHERIVSGIAGQAAVAIDNAKLHETAQRTQEQLRQLNEGLELEVAERTSKLVESETQFQQLVAGVRDAAIYLLDRTGHVVSWNPGAERIKGYTAAEITGQHFSMFYTDEDRERGVPARTLAIAAEEGKYEAEAWRVRKDGTRFWASVLLDAIRDEQGNVIGFAKVTRDMTERKAMQEQLHQSQKMEAIGQLTGGVAHDFNNLLTVILGNLETLGRHLPEHDGRLRRAVDHATRGAQRAATLTQQLLAFARRQPLNPKPTDVNRLVIGMSDLVRRTLSENISVETVLGGGLWRVEVDPHQLESALINLAVNARDAMPSGGKLTIETANSHLDENYASRFAEIAPGQYVSICVTDTGTGMSADVMARAFDPFFTTKPIGEGTGLGLSQVFGFVKQSGGHIKLYSEVGEGTTVKIYLPRMIADMPLQEPESKSYAPKGSSSETILVVEDDEDVRIYSTESLRELGFTVLEAHDGQSALRVLEHHPEVMLLFTDVGLPGINGRELVDHARKRRPGLRVLFTTGYARNAIVHQGRLDSGVELLTKPFTRTQLASRIRDVLDAPARPHKDEPVALIVEDEPLIRLFLVDLLGDVGYRTVPVSSAREALAESERLSSVDVAFIDIGLPDRSGIDVAAELRLRWPSLRVAIASGYGDQARTRVQRDANTTFLSKPFDAAAVAATLHSLGLDASALAG
jgi:PAS domain S-box-containing protein